MVYKLVRCDTVDPCKIQLPSGSHLIGRGKYLECDDKRVSRNHGELEVTEDSVIIKALHQNPCFYLKKGTSETQILRQNGIASLSNGDRFGLLPDSHWYELLLCNSSDVNRSPEVNKEEDDSNIQHTASDKTILGSDLNNEFENDFSEDLNAETSKNIDTSLNNDAQSEEPNSPSVLSSENQASTQEYRVDDDIEHAANTFEKPETLKSPAKRCHIEDSSSNPEETKRIKVELPDIKKEPEDVTPGPSANGSSEDSNNARNDTPPSPAKVANNATLRERCMYGGNCYRQNPQHKVQFSHPTDSDWGAGERGQCPWGAGCTRRDPRHWRDHEHPPGVQPPPPHHQQYRPGKNKKKKRANESSESNLIVTGKRVRKTVKRTSWSGSESENEYDMDDPFLTDGSDEWAPPSDIEESQDNTPDTLDY